MDFFLPRGQNFVTALSVSYITVFAVNAELYDERRNLKTKQNRLS